MLSKYVFDFNVVAALDPSYSKYLEEVNTQVKTPIPENASNPNDIENEDIIQFMHDGKATDKYNSIEEMLVEETTTKKYRLKKVDACTTAKPMDIPLLPPPKQVLAPGSVIWINKDTVYHVRHGNENNGFVVYLIKYKQYYNHPKVGLMKIVYRFDKIHNVVSEIRKQFTLLIYNLDTKKMYYVVKYNTKKRGKLKTRIIQISWNANILQNAIANYPIKLVKRFAKLIENHITNLIPDVCKPPKRLSGEYLNITKTLFMLTLQHKVGQRLQWLANERFVNYLLYFTCFPHITYPLAEIIDPSDSCVPGKEATFYRKTIYKLLPKLRKTPTEKTVTKTIFGPFYRNIHHELLTLFSNSSVFTNSNKVCIFLINLTYLINTKLLPNSVYHTIVHLTKEKTERACQQLLEISGAINELTNAYKDRIPTIQHYLKLYIRVINNTNKNDVISWITFRDLLNMAKDLNIRIRINKFKCQENIQQLHDRLAMYQQRDLEVCNKYEGFEFVVFKSPEKEYDGFRFIQLTTPEALVEEGKTMRHCVGGYSPRCLRGKSIIYSMIKNNRRFATIEIDGNTRDGCTIIQKYTIGDITITNQYVLDIIENWRKDLEQLHINDKASYQLIAKMHYEYQKTIKKLNTFNSVYHTITDADERRLAIKCINNLQNTINAIEQQMEKLNAETFKQTVTQTA